MTVFGFLSLMFSPVCLEQKPVMFFDLGETLIHFNQEEKVSYTPGAYEYLTRLKEKNFEIGLISNIPQAWGYTYDQKLNTLKKFVKENWIDSKPNVFSFIPDSNILIPMVESERKPAPFLYLRAKSFAEAKHTGLIYQGESVIELEAAKSLGIRAYQVGVHESYFMPIPCL